MPATVSPRPKRGATSFADVPDEEPAESPAPAVDSARTAELQEFLRAGLPAAQAFSIRPGRDTMIVGAQGTQLLIPGNAWDLPDSAATVQLEVQEFYSPADMILAGLSTTSGTELLETGGMLRVTATAKGRPVQLRPGRYVHLRMPAKEKKPGMQLFTGTVRGHDQRVDWRLPTGHGSVARVEPAGKARKAREESTDRSHFEDVPRPQMKWPEYEELHEEMRQAFRAPSGTRRRLHRVPDASFREKMTLEELSQTYDVRIVRRATVAFTVDSSGAVTRAVPDPGTDPELGAIASQALLKMKAWNPAELPRALKGHVRTENTPAVCRLNLAFPKVGNPRVYLSAWSLPSPNRKRAKALRHELDSLLAETGFRKRYRQDLDSLEALKQTRQGALAEQERARLRTQFTDTSRAAVTSAGVYNELSTQGLNLINCDRFMNAVARVAYKVRVPESDAITSLVFKEMNSVMRGQDTGGFKVLFDRVPLGKSATVVALRREAGVTYLATRSVLVQPMALETLRFHPVTMAELRAELARLQ